MTLYVLYHLQVIDFIPAPSQEHSVDENHGRECQTFLGYIAYMGTDREGRGLLAVGTRIGRKVFIGGLE